MTPLGEHYRAVIVDNKVVVGMDPTGHPTRREALKALLRDMISYSVQLRDTRFLADIAVAEAHDNLRLASSLESQKGELLHLIQKDIMEGPTA